MALQPPLVSCGTRHPSRSPKGESLEVLNLVNVVGIEMYLFVLSSVLADSHPGKPARLSSVGVPPSCW